MFDKLHDLQRYVEHAGVSDLVRILADVESWPVCLPAQPETAMRNQRAAELRKWIEVDEDAAISTVRDFLHDQARDYQYLTTGWLR